MFEENMNEYCHGVFHGTTSIIRHSCNNMSVLRELYYTLNKIQKAYFEMNHNED